LDWDHARALLAVADAGGLKHAAQALGLSEATVGRQMGALERALGVRLIERLANRVELTPTGRRLAEAARGMAEGAAAVERLALAAAAEPGMPVRVTTTTSIALFLTGQLERLLAAAAPAPLELVATRTALSLPRREAEVALRMRRPPEQGDLLVRRVGRLAFALYARRGTAGDELIGLRADPGSRQSAWLEQQAVTPPRLRLADLALRLAAVRRGLGASLLPCFLGDEDPELERLAAPAPELVEDVYLLVHRDLRDLPQVRAVALELTRLLHEHDARLGGLGGPHR